VRRLLVLAAGLLVGTGITPRVCLGGCPSNGDLSVFEDVGRSGSARNARLYRPRNDWTGARNRYSDTLLAQPSAKPQRVASINLSADEVLSAILPPERLVSVTRWVDEPGTSNVVGKIPPGVFRFVKRDMEQLVALRPDLVVVSEYTDADFLKLLEVSGLRVHRMVGLGSVRGVRAAILDLGRAVGEDASTRALVERFDATLAELNRRLAGAKRPRVLYWSSNMTAGADTAIGSLIEAGGGTNVGREMGVTGISPPGAEKAFVADPEVVLVGTWPNAKEALTEHPLLSQMRAVREGRIVALPTERLVALSQFTADAAWDLAHLLHPDRVPATIPARGTRP
jgi:iron complex transport system substrate-binding protein